MSPRLDEKLLADYDSTRPASNRGTLCHAPYKNIYFNVGGQGAACWLTFFEAPRYPEHSIHDIWFGKYYENLRGLIRDKNLSERCQVCERNISNRLFGNPLAKAYDSEHPIKPYPSIMEFELSNTCNLGCTMCNGRLSSTIRRTRDELPPHVSPYDSAFVEQLGEFIPHLEEARFNGGEPFLQKLCAQAWERIIEIKKSVMITVATNGTVWNDRVSDVLERGTFRINLSLDGMSPGTYEAIRRGSHFDRVIKNAEKFGDHCRRKGTIFSIMVNPMRPNWRELPTFVEFCSSRGYYLWFNTIYRPFHLALWTLSSEELGEIYKTLSSHKFSLPAGADRGLFEGNVQKFRNLVEGQMMTWMKEQQERERKRGDYASEQLRRQHAKASLLERMGSAVADPSKLGAMLQKLSFLEGKVRKNIEPQDFYHHVGELPLDWLLSDLEHKSADEMTELVYNRAEYY